jgi:hypothetical protein
MEMRHSPHIETFGKGCCSIRCRMLFYLSSPSLTRAWSMTRPRGGVRAVAPAIA